MGKPVQASLTSLSFTSRTGAADDDFLEIDNGSAVAVSVAGKIRLRYVSASGELQVSINGGAWTPITTGPGDYVGKFEQDAIPDATQIPDGKWAFWWDTDDSRMWIVRNRGGTMYSVELT